MAKEKKLGELALGKANQLQILIDKLNNTTVSELLDQIEFLEDIDIVTINNSDENSIKLIKLLMIFLILKIKLKLSTVNLKKRMSSARRI